jgi:hypothetical protein
MSMIHGGDRADHDAMGIVGSMIHDAMGIVGSTIHDAPGGPYNGLRAIDP